MAIELFGGDEGDDIRNGLMMIKDYHGASGIIEFDEKGVVHKPMGMKVIRNGGVFDLCE